jgi:AcrR family transcriptional regulator
MMDSSAMLRALSASLPASAEDELHGRILDAAHELFLSFGLRRTTIDGIAKRAGLGRPTLYRRFRDKDAIVQAVFMRESRRLIAEVWGQVADVREPDEVLVRAFVVATRIVATHPLTRRLLDTEAELILPHMMLNAGPLIDLGHALIDAPARELQSRGHFQGLDVELLLEVMARLFLSVVTTPSTRLDASEAKLEQLAEGVLRPMLERRR